jgi:DNA-binding transcriptional ArsR family regulator
MPSKNDIKNQITELKKELEELRTLKGSEKETQRMLSSREKPDAAGAYLMLANTIKVMNSRLDDLASRLNHIENVIDADLEEGTMQGVPQQSEELTTTTKIVPISEIDKRILQAIQRLDLACADDIKKAMSYKGRNAASARLKRLEKDRLIERYQLGRKVYYRLLDRALNAISPREEIINK